jgi:hypothetical protein
MLAAKDLWFLQEKSCGLLLQYACCSICGLIDADTDPLPDDFVPDPDTWSAEYSTDCH